MKVHLKVWRQRGPSDPNAGLRDYTVEVSPHMSFLEMLDVLNDDLVRQGQEPIVFDHDCREGICGSCGVMINGEAHGPRKATTTCQVHMREFKDGDTLTIEPWRANAFPVIKDLMVDRTSLDRIIAAGGYVSVRTGPAPDANATPIPKKDADTAFDFAACIQCGACVAACPNASAMLFTAAKVSHLAVLPQGKVEREERALKLVAQHDLEGFGGCTNHGECEAVCPKLISMDSIAKLNRELARASLRSGN